MMASERMSTTRLLQPNELPRSVRKMLLLPDARTVSTAWRMSQGETNCPFLMLTARARLPASTSRSVCRQRKAGICTTSATSVTAATSDAWCTSVNTGTPTSWPTLFRMRRPSLSPGPRKLLSEVRFALSYEALKTYGTLSVAAMALIEWAILSVCDSLSITHGPAIRKSSAPARKPFTSNWLCDDMAAEDSTH